MILSIGMIMKNEEKYLRDCLTALQPILENVASELIICDTGSTDNSIKIAKEFTDNVLEIGWRNDFAWARQQGFQLAKGEWFFVLDSDEIFQDVQAIIDFFNSGEYKNFGCATVKLNNAPNKEYRVSISENIRLFKIVDNMKWQNKIHENLSPFVGPAKNLDSTCLHYGYLPNEKIDKNKRKRNLELVLEIYNENPKDYRNILSLINEYPDKPEMQRKYAEIGLPLVKETEFAENYNGVPHFYPAYIQQFTQIYNKLFEYEKTIECVEEYFNAVPPSQIAANAHYLKYQQTFAFIKTEQFEEAKQAAFAAFAFKKQADKNQLRKEVLGNIILPVMDDDEFIVNILETFVLLNQFGESIAWLEKTLSQDDKIDQYRCYANFVSLMLAKNPKMLSSLYWHFAQNHPKYNEIVTVIESGIKSQSDKIDLAKNILEKAANLSTLPTLPKNPYIELQRLRLALKEDSPKTAEYLEYFLQQKEISPIYADVLVAAIKHGKYFEELSQKINIVSYIKLFERTVPAMNASWQVVETNDILLDLGIINQFLRTNGFMKDCTSIAAVRFICGMLSSLTEKIGLVGDNKKRADLQKQLLLFELFARMSHKYCKMLYAKELYCEKSINLLTDKDQTTFYLGTAYEHKTTGNVADFAKYMRLALKASPQYKSTIQKITSTYLNQNEQPPKTAQDQLQQEIASLKTLLYTMIDMGNTAQARQILAAYTQINPTDKDIATINKMLN
ncbi:MAG: glycosyltransferase [Firmicutes bacterium]|nr:glycosyltransferase [Bacillota bacterium]